MVKRVILAAVLFVLVSSDGQARPRDRFHRQQAAPSCSTGSCSAYIYSGVGIAEAGNELPDALDVVNSARAARGMKPYIRDHGLMAGALACARARAANFIRGHTSNDFAYLPPGSSAAAGGAGALEPSWGFQACAMYEHHTYAGAAWVMGRDGRMYCQIFVR